MNDVAQADILQEIPAELWPDLRDLFRANWPYAIHIYYFIDNYTRWKAKVPATEITIWCPDGRWDDGTFIAVNQDGAFNIIMFTLEKSGERLLKALMETRRIKWEYGPLLNYIHADHFRLVDEFIARKNLRVAAETQSCYNWMPIAEAKNLNISCPPDVYLSAVNATHVDVINNAWTYRYIGSENYIRKLVTMNGGIGLFGKCDNQLRSWALIYDSGGVGVLHTLDEHKRKGYGALVTRALSRQLAEQGKDVVVFVSQTNWPSLALFKSLGFRFIDKCRWIYITDTVNFSNVNLDWH